MTRKGVCTDESGIAPSAIGALKPEPDGAIRELEDLPESVTSLAVVPIPSTAGRRPRYAVLAG